MSVATADAPPSTRRFETAAGRLEIRSSVASREHAIDGGTALYLSLYEDEIGLRAEAFWERLKALGPEAAACHLELTDAVICFADGDGGWATRGGAAAFPLYRQRTDDRMVFATGLPIAAGEDFSRAGLVAAAAAACLHGSYEPNGFVETPLARWSRVRRAAFLRFSGGEVVCERLLQPPAIQTAGCREEVAAQVRAAFERYGASQNAVSRSLLELSGGYDSTLAAAAAPRHAMSGASVWFPYYEFRFERGVQSAVAEALAVDRVEFDGTELYPYTPSDIPSRFDEPSVFVTGIRHSETIARHAAELGAERIFMGHGGDQCFATDLTAREELVANPLSRGPFTRTAWRAVGHALSASERSAFTARSTGTFICDARQDVWVKETFGPTVRTPFSDLAVFHAALAWSRHCAGHGRGPDKSILAEALPELLPEAVVTRKGKVAYDGVWARAYRQQADHIAAVFDRTSAVLETIGVSPAWLIERVRALADWRDVSDREVLAVYAIATWLDSWDIARPGDVSWLP